MRRIRVSATVIAFSISAVGLVLAAVALASRPATRAERAEITRLVHHDRSGDIAEPGRVHVRKIVVSSKAPWASAELAIHFADEQGDDTAGGLFKRTAGHYRLVRVGSDAIGCGLISNAVSEELDLGRCP